MRIEGLFVAALLGWAAGWLVNGLAHILPYQRHLGLPNCQACEREIPLARFLIGRACPNCAAERPPRFWVVQLVLVVLFVWLYFVPNSRMPFWMAAVLVTYLGLVAVIDLEHRLILHPVSLAGAVIGFGLGSWMHGWANTLIGGAAGFGIMLLLYLLGNVLGRWLAHRRGQELEEVALGFGDVNLAGVIGLLLGWPGVVLGLFLAVLFGGVASLGVIAIQLAARRYQPFTAIPYAPFLILGALLLLYRP